MEVLNHRSALLSNFEVLTLLRELESDHLAKTRTAIRVKKEEEAAGISASRVHVPQEQVLENLRTIEVEAIQYLSADYQPAVSQTEAGITQLTRNLSSYDLTKAEKLQIVNLAPTEPVELYVIVEELEDRFSNQTDDILEVVKSSLNGSHPISAAALPRDPQESHETEDLVYPEEDVVWEDSETTDVVFDDTGEGIGVEGDLEADED